jgi:hypothetical protein
MDAQTTETNLDVIPKKTIEEFVEPSPSTDFKTYLRQVGVKVYSQPIKKIGECVKDTKKLLNKLLNNEDIMRYVQEINSSPNFDEDDEYVEHEHDDNYMNMMIFCSKFAAILKVRFCMNNGEWVYGISLHYSPFYGDIVLIREYLGKDGSIIHTEYFEKNVPIEILFADVFQMKSRADCNAAAENLIALLLENRLFEYHFKPEIQQLESSFGDEPAWVIFEYKKYRYYDNVRAIQFRFCPHHLKINIEIRKVYNNSNNDGCYMRIDSEKFSKEQIKKTIMYLTA